MKISKGLIKLVIVLGVLLLIWVLRPLGIVHDSLMSLYIYSPVFVVSGIITILATLCVYVASIKEKTRKLEKNVNINKIKEEAAGNAMAAFVFIGFIVLLIVGGLLGEYGNAAMYTDMYHATHYREVPAIPVLNNNNTRAVPMIVAQSLMNKYFTEARYYPDSPFISEINGSLVWVSQLTPDGTINHFTLEPKGLIYVPMARMTVKTIITRMDCGKNIGITDNIIWILRKHKYWVKYDVDNAVPVVRNNTIYYIVPYISYHWHFTHVTPYWGGVAVVNTRTKKVRYLSPQEAAREYGSLPIFPESLARMYASSMNYYKESALSNWWNVHVKHGNQIEIPSYNVGGNGQPFFVQLKNGKGAWFIAAEPYGTGSGIKRIIVVTMNGTIYYRHFSSPVTGVSAAMSAIENALPRFDWSQFNIVEPIPVEVNGQLYWRFVIVPNGESTIKMIALVPMKSSAIQPSDIKFFDSIGQYKAFLQGKKYVAPVNGSTVNSAKTIIGTVKQVWSYTVNGTTHFLVKISVNNSTKLVDVPVSCLNTGEIAMMFQLHANETVTFKWNGQCYVPDS